MRGQPRRGQGDPRRRSRHDEESAEDIDTIGGFIVTLAGRVPVPQRADPRTGQSRIRGSRRRSPPGETRCASSAVNCRRPAAPDATHGLTIRRPPNRASSESPAARMSISSPIASSSPDRVAPRCCGLGRRRRRRARHAALRLSAGARRVAHSRDLAPRRRGPARTVPLARSKPPPSSAGAGASAISSPACGGSAPLFWSRPTNSPGHSRLGVLGLPALLAFFPALGFILARLFWTADATRILAFAAGLTRRANGCAAICSPAFRGTPPAWRSARTSGSCRPAPWSASTASPCWRWRSAPRRPCCLPARHPVAA